LGCTRRRIFAFHSLAHFQIQARAARYRAFISQRPFQEQPLPSGQGKGNLWRRDNLGTVSGGRRFRTLAYNNSKWTLQGSGVWQNEPEMHKIFAAGWTARTSMFESARFFVHHGHKLEIQTISA
jgi:hypothetical protein